MVVMANLDGHLPTSHPLSPYRRLLDWPRLTRAVVAYRRDDLWDADTRTLPAPLANLRRRARHFAEQQMAPLAAIEDQMPHDLRSGPSPVVQQLLRNAGRDGWLSYFLPRPLGSMDWRCVRYPMIWQCALVVEEFSRVCGGLMLLLSAHHLGCMPLLLSGDLKTIRRFLLPVYHSCQRGNPHLMAFAITEPGAGSDAEDGHGAASYRPGVIAKRTDGGWLLNGRKCFISGGDVARSLTVFAALEGEGMDSWTCFHVDADSEGFHVARTEMKMGMRASGAAELEFDDVFVADDHVIGGLRNGWTLNRATLNSSRIPVASMAVGFARAATEEAVSFACQYQLGGKPLIQYQDVQQQMATLVAETRAIRSLVWQEARHAWQPRQLNASLCKFHATDRAQHVVEMAMDLLAEHGTLHENRLEKIFRDVRLTRIFEGTNQINQLSLIEDWQDQLLPIMQGTCTGTGV